MCHDTGKRETHCGVLTFCADCDCVALADCVHVLVVIACNCLYVCVCLIITGFWFSFVSVQLYSGCHAVSSCTCCCVETLICCFLAELSVRRPSDS